MFPISTGEYLVLDYIFAISDDKTALAFDDRTFITYAIDEQHISTSPRIAIDFPKRSSILSLSESSSNPRAYRLVCLAIRKEAIRR